MHEAVDIKVLMNDIKDLCCEGIDYLRNEATDIVAFVVVDSQCLHRPGIPPHIPIAYAMRGPSFTTDTLRKMLNDVRECCKSHNAGIMCEITDGEFIKLVHTSENGQPLTHFQCLKSMFKFYEQYSRAQLVDMIVNEVHPPFNMRWHDVHTPIASDIWKQHSKKLQLKQKKMANSNANSNRKSTEDLSIQDKLDLTEGTKSNRRLKGQTIVVDRQGQPTNTPVASTSTSDGQSSTTGGNSKTTASDNMPLSNYTSDVWFSAANLSIPDSDHESDSDFTLNESEIDEDSSDDDINAVLDSDEEEYEVNVPGGNLRDIPNPLMLPMHPCMDAILRALRRSKYKIKWNNENTTSLFDNYLCSREKLMKLKHVEMNIIQDELLKFFGKKIFLKTELKADKVNALSRQFCPMIYLNDSSDTSIQRSASNVKTMASLFSTYKKYLSSDKYPKELLKAVVCQIHNDDHLKTWKDNCPVPLVFKIPEENFQYEIYCYPNFNNNTQELECRSLDPSHILNNIRSQICRHGYTGVTTRAFHEVSNRNNKIISKNTLESNMDRQKVGISVDFFSEEVERILRELNFDSEANFVQTTRKWYQACDECGIPSIQ